MHIQSYKEGNTVIMRILGKAGLRPQPASSSCLSLSPCPPSCLPNPLFLFFLSFIGSLYLYIYSGCIAGQDVIHFNDFERSCMSLLALFSSFAMSHSKISFFYVQTHTRAPTHTSTHAYSFHKHTLTHTFTNGTVIKNETTGFLKTPRTEGKVSSAAVKRVPLETMRRMIICCS